MSRTYRRKNSSRRWLWLYYDNESEFQAARECSLKDYTELFARKPKLPSASKWISKYDWKSDRIVRVLVSDPVVVAEWDAWDAYHRSDEYRELQIGVRFIQQTGNAKTYDEYVRNARNEMTRDSRCGPSWCGNAPHWYCNQYFERPMRRAVKRTLKHAYKYDTFDDTVYPEWLNGAAWSYW